MNVSVKEFFQSAFQSRKCAWMGAWMGACLLTTLFGLLEIKTDNVLLTLQKKDTITICNF